MINEPISKSTLTVSPYIKRELPEVEDDIPLAPDPISRPTTLAPIGETSTTGTQTEQEDSPVLDPIIICNSSSVTHIFQAAGGSVISILVRKNAELERKLDGLMDYLEKWINVGELNMNDIKQYIENYTN